MNTVVKSSEAMLALGEKLGNCLVGGEVIELEGDIGAGKTTLTKGIAKGLSVHDDVSSPTFTVSRVYSGRDNILLAHYDFYRLTDAGIMAIELAEATGDSSTVTVVEWGGIVSEVLPADTLRIQISHSQDENSRSLNIQASGEKSSRVLEALA